MSSTRVGIREFRNNLKVYLEQVERGDSIEITKNGRTIGVLVPKQRDDDAVERLIAEGTLLPAESGHHDVRLPRRIQPSSASPSTDELLDELRAES
jgi:prevent-host-death family protein